MRYLAQHGELRRILSHPFVLAGLAALFASLVALTASLLASWLPAIRHSAQAATRTESQLAELKELRLRQTMAELYRTRVAEVEGLEGKLRLARSEPEFVAEIEKLAAASAVDLLQFSSRPAPKDKGSTESTVFEFFLKGDYAGLKTFIAGVRGLPEFVTVERVVLERLDPSVRARVLMKRHTARRA